MRGHRSGFGRGRGHGRHRGHSLLHTRLLEPALLTLLESQQTHAYPLLEELERFGLGSINPSVVYRALRSMEDQGWVTSEWEHEETQGPARRIYALTADGHDVLAAWRVQLASTLSLIEGLLAYKPSSNG